MTTSARPPDADALGSVGTAHPGGNPALLQQGAGAWRDLAAFLQSRRDHVDAPLAQSRSSW